MSFMRHSIEQHHFKTKTKEYKIKRERERENETSIITGWSVAGPTDTEKRKKWVVLKKKRCRMPFEWEEDKKRKGRNRPKERNAFGVSLLFLRCCVAHLSSHVYIYCTVRRVLTAVPQSTVSYFTFERAIFKTSVFPISAVCLLAFFSFLFFFEASTLSHAPNFRIYFMFIFFPSTICFIFISCSGRIVKKRIPTQLCTTIVLLLLFSSHLFEAMY